jgi:16S rRNA processing protein RimM
MTPDDLLLVGRVARAHGNRGQVIVNPDTDFADERFKAGQTLLVGPEDNVQPRRIQDVRFHQGRPIIRLEGVETMDDAEALAGTELRMRTGEMAPLPEGTYRHHELIGCEVRDPQDRVIGRVMSIEGPTERSRLVVDGTRGEVLIPLVADICVSIDPAAQRIVVNPPEGLLELNTRKGDSHPFRSATNGKG